MADAAGVGRRIDRGIDVMAGQTRLRELSPGGHADLSLHEQLQLGRHCNQVGAERLLCPHDGSR